MGASHTTRRTCVWPCPPCQGARRDLWKHAGVLIGELSKRISRSADTIKRWEDLGLIVPSRDARGRRVYSDADVPRCMELAALGLLAMVQSRKLSELAQQDVPQLSFDFAEPRKNVAA